MGLSKNKVLRKIFFAITGSLSEHSPRISSHLAYFFARKRFLHLNPPCDLNEKFMWLKLHIYNYHPLVALCADKYAMRQYVEQKGCPELLNELYGVWKSADEIDFDKLPDKFVIKCNHGSGYNLICNGKETFDIEQARIVLDSWMKKDFWRRSAELQYKNTPRRIFCEKYLESDGKMLPDYKLMCFYGEPQYILYCDGRDTNLRYINFTLDWKLLPYNSVTYEDEVPKPKSLDRMIAYAKLLSRDFPAVRVDFYEHDGELILGELTFTPAACIGIALPQAGLDYYGECLDLKTELTKKMYREAQKYKKISDNKSEMKNKKGKEL